MSQGLDPKKALIWGGSGFGVFIAIALAGGALDPAKPGAPVETRAPAMTETETAAEVTGVSGRAQVGPNEWRIADAIASLTATDGDLVLGVLCTNDIVDQVAIGFGNEPPSIWVHGGLYLSVDGGAIHSNWSQRRTGDFTEPWRGHNDELESLDGPRLLERLAKSTRLVVEAGRFPDPWPPPAGWPYWSAVFDGSGLAATLAQMACRIPSSPAPL